MTRTDFHSQRTIRSSMSLRARDPLSLLGLGFVVVSLLAVQPVQTIVADAPRLVIIGSILIGALVLPALPAFLLGQVALVPLFSVTITPEFALAQAGLACLLFEPAREYELRLLVGLTVVVGSILAVGTFVASTRGLVTAGLILFVTVGTGVYLLHRLTLVRLGQVTRTPDDDDEAADNTPEAGVP